MTDLISRADAIERFCEFGTSLERQGKTMITMVDAKYAFIETLESLPSADAEWIPCSERLPSESDDYICTIPLDAEETYTEVLTFHKGRFYEDDDEWGAIYHDDVLAWMPLPKPYKGGDDE